MIARLGSFVKPISVSARLAKTGLLACVLATTVLSASASNEAASHRPATSGIIRASGVGQTSNKTVVNLRALAAVDSKVTQPHQVDASSTATAATASRPKSAPFAAGAVQNNAAAPFIPTLDTSFDGLRQSGVTSVPDPNAAASATQIVEVVNQSRLRVYNRNGDICGTVNLDTFFSKAPNEFFGDPRVIYDNVKNKFTVIMTVITTPPTGPHLPGFAIIRIAHNQTSDACGQWTTYSLLNLGLNEVDVPEGNFVDQPAIGQDHDAFLFGGASVRQDASNLSYLAFSLPKSCAYAAVPGCSFPIFTTAHYATPASSAGNPMITTSHSYFVASVKGIGYELYRMDNSANASLTTLVLQQAIAAVDFAKGPTRNPNQPGAGPPIDLDLDDPLGFFNRITSTPTYDGVRIWFAHQTSAGPQNHPGVRYGAIDTTNNTVAGAVASYSATSDDFNPSIAVGLSGNGTLRTVFLNWVYTDPGAGVPVSVAVAAVRISNTDPLPPIAGPQGEGRPVLTVIRGGITGNREFGDYSSVSIDPLNLGQVCAVAANEYFDKDDGSWITRISRFGAAGC